MNIRTPLFASALLAASLISGTAQAALFDRGGGLIYDDDLNVTWLQDANYAVTQYLNTSGVEGHNAGLMWEEAVAWAANLNYYDSVRGTTYSDWRLPYSSNCAGANCVSSEMGHLFYGELGGASNHQISTTHNSNYDLFINITSTKYWTNSYLNDVNAWHFDFWDGRQNTSWKPYEFPAWAVRDGDVAAIPEPDTYAMMLAGLGLVGFLARSRKP